ncbi:MAG: shikimate kinase [Burkholderiaceae bacterium]|nr:shikimate kinase [Burkholderiaceae bacterium]
MSAASAIATGSRTSIFLVGMMGSGKTTVGKRLAKRLGLEFIDADKEIEARCGVPVATIFEVEGEEGFRRREAALIDELTRRPAIVLATGGGAVLGEPSRRHLRERGVVVYLCATAPDLWNRLRADKVRPLLRAANPRELVFDLVAFRDPLYRECADLVILTGRQPAARVVAQIVAALPPGLHAAG